MTVLQVEKAPIFEKIYQDYLSQVAGLSLSGKEEILGIRLSENEISIPLFNREFRVTPKGISDDNGNQPLHAVSVLLCRYLILCPALAPSAGDEWVSYKDFQDAAPFVSGFVNNSEKSITKNFSGKLSTLEEACRKLGGFHATNGLSYDLAMQIYSLPKIPLYMLFNDADEEFPAECRMLFERRAKEYLDMECLAIVGWLFADYLALLSGQERHTIM